MLFRRKHSKKGEKNHLKERRVPEHEKPIDPDISLLWEKYWERRKHILDEWSEGSVDPHLAFLQRYMSEEHRKKIKGLKERGLGPSGERTDNPDYRGYDPEENPFHRRR